uniref:Borealin N-terminal domain-containing protein n=1 Tax=Salarias fasciatus TaxID=181472 RepID=A0A672J7L0_SALFA
MTPQRSARELCRRCTRSKMAGRRPRNARNGPSKERLSREMRRSKMTLFIQQVEKEAQERVNELEAKTESLLTTVDKVFRVELMKKPPSLQSTLIGELLSCESDFRVQLCFCFFPRGSSVTAGRAQSGLQGHTASSQKKPKLRSVLRSQELVPCAATGFDVGVTLSLPQVCCVCR